jgi:hypothetical protein
MKNQFKSFALAALLMVCTGSALATNYSLWINGMSMLKNAGKEGQYNDFSYWGPIDTNPSVYRNEAGVNPRAVNWDGMQNVALTNKHIVNALDRYCTGGNWCYVAAHSAGNLQIGYALANEGQSKRPVHQCKAPGQVPINQDECTRDPNGNTQTGWNIKSVRVAGGAAGGSEAAAAANTLALAASYIGWLFGEEEGRAFKTVADKFWGHFILRDLGPINARALYDHNATAGVQFNMYAGAKHRDFFLFDLALIGDDDNLVPYHSAGGTAGSTGRALCNSRKLFCAELTDGNGSNINSTAWWPLRVYGGQKWNNHTVAFRDDKTERGEYAHGSGDGPKVWGGIIGVVKTAMKDNSK